MTAGRQRSTQAAEVLAIRGTAGQGFDDDVQRAAAGQAEALGLFRRLAIAEELRPLGGQFAGRQRGQQVVLGARRRAPGGNHGCEPEPFAGVQPGAHLIQNLMIRSTHSVLQVPR